MSHGAAEVTGPAWLILLAWTSLGLGMACALWVTVDVIRRPPRMGVMRVVWPLTMLYGGAAGLWFYLRHGHDRGGHTARETGPSPSSIAKGTSHCGAGCSLGDLVAEFLVAAVPAFAVAVGWTHLYAERMFAAWIWDFVLAYLFGIALQYFAIAPMRDAGFGANLLSAVKADTASILAWQVGIYAVMGVLQLWLVPALLGGRLAVTSPVFWFGMQWAMLAGFACAYPVNRVLIARGIKEAM